MAKSPTAYNGCCGMWLLPCLGAADHAKLEMRRPSAALSNDEPEEVKSDIPIVNLPKDVPDEVKRDTNTPRGNSKGEPTLRRNVPDGVKRDTNMPRVASSKEEPTLRRNVQGSCQDSDASTACPEMQSRNASLADFSEIDALQHDEAPITANELGATMVDLAKGVKPWASGKFVYVQKLQEAVRNQGRVDLMFMPNGTGKRKVVVKRMPNSWVRASSAEFQKFSPLSSERPWHDFGFVKMLHQRGSPYVCELFGIFADDKSTYVASELASEGDLFEWCNSDPRPSVSHAREAVMKPLLIQIFSAVRWIHAMGIAHRDLSLENILLNKEQQGLRIKIIDFGMSTLKRTCSREIRGKASYQAPEMLEEKEYDAFLTDSFALGVVVMTMAVHDYPWKAVKKNACQFFEYFRAFGLEKLLKRRKLRNGNGERLIDVISEPLVELLEGLLAVDPAERLTLGEPCWALSDGQRLSVWDLAWLQGCSPRN